jgi:hypothetical protein
MAAIVAKASAPFEPESAAESDDSPPADSPAPSGSKEESPATKDEGKKADADADKSPSPAEDPKLAAKFAALGRRSEKLRTREDAIKATESKVAEREAALEARAKELESREARLRELDEAERDPQKLTAYLKSRNVSAEHVTAGYLAESDPGVRAELEAKRAMARAEALEKQMREERAAADAAKKSHEEAAARAVVEASEARFVAVISDEAKFEAANLAYSESERVALAYHVDKLARAKGLKWGIDEIAGAVNEFAEAGYALNARGEVVKNDRYAKIKARLTASPPAAPAPAVAAPSQTIGNGQRATPPKTMTNRDAAERSTTTDLDSLPMGERIRLLAERANAAGD